MPWTATRPHAHECLTPDPNFWWNRRKGPGSIWRCAECGKEWEVLRKHYVTDLMTGRPRLHMVPRS